jgi:hypothetical protein
VPETRPTLTIYEEAREPEDTGLVNAEGWPIYRHPKVESLGFVGKVK